MSAEFAVDLLAAANLFLAQNNDAKSRCQRVNQKGIRRGGKLAKFRSLECCSELQVKRDEVGGQGAQGKWSSSRFGGGAAGK